MPYAFKQDKQHVQINVRGKGLLDKSNINNPFGQMLAKDIMENYPQWKHNLVEVPERKSNEPTKIPFDLKKNKASLSTLTAQPTDGEPLKSNVQEPKSTLSESLPKPGPSKEGLEQKKSDVSVPTKKPSRGRPKKA